MVILRRLQLYFICWRVYIQYSNQSSTTFSKPFMRKSDTIKSFRKKKSQELVRVVNYLNSVKMQMNFEASKLAAAAGWSSITLSSRHSHGFRISKKKVCQKFANPNTFFIMKNAKRHPLQHECNEYNFFSQNM